MKVVAMKPILYNGKIYDNGEVLEMDDVSYLVRLKRGDIEKVNELVTEEEINVAEGLPPLDEVPHKKRK